MHTSMNYPLLFPSFCLRCTTSRAMVVEKQCGYETYITPALLINNIDVFT